MISPSHAATGAPSVTLAGLCHLVRQPFLTCSTKRSSPARNVGVAAPMAYFPFSGWKDSFFGDLHAQGRDAIDFYTEKKVVVERWPATWSRKF